MSGEFGVSIDLVNGLHRQGAATDGTVYIVTYRTSFGVQRSIEGTVLDLISYLLPSDTILSVDKATL